MKFWLRTGSRSIALEQFFKAMGWCDDYIEIRRIIEQGEVQVNDSVTCNRHEQLKEGYTVRWHGQHIIIAGKRIAHEEAMKRKDLGDVPHGRELPRWTEKPVKKREKKDE